MVHIVDVKEGVQFKDYDLYSSLAKGVRDLNHEAFLLVPKIKGRKVWMVNSTDQGGGVAEMMPRLISLLRQLGVECDWVVAGADNKDFFNITKKVHNLIHGEGGPAINEQEKEIYEAINKKNAEELLKLLKPHDIVVIHDPQPMGIAMYLKDNIDVKCIWRCHIGFDIHTSQTESAWKFLMPYSNAYSSVVFSNPEYIPGHFAGKAIVMFPSIDPLDHKNRDLPIHKVVGILCNSNLVTEYHPVLTAPFTDPVKRLQPDGSFQSPLLPSDIGLLFKPIVLQISRWDRLKGFLPLMKGFVELKKNIAEYSFTSSRNVRRIEMAQLVLAGPDPDYVKDDPEGNAVLHELIQYYLSLDAYIQPYIAILKLPMSSRKNNELIVNALQRVASIVVQNSLKEGFGLTVTEAMWKVKPVIGSCTCGIRHQVRDGLDGLIIQDPHDVKEIAHKINYALEKPKEAEVWGYYAQKRVIEKYLIFTQLRQWLRLFASI